MSRRRAEAPARVLAGALLAAAGCAVAEIPDSPVVAPQEHARWLAPLDSGARVLVLEDRSAPSVTAVAVFGAGGTDDPPRKEGLAHLVEHLTFRSRPGGGSPLRDQLKQMGATFNAYTTSDLTVYYSIAHKDQLPRLLELEGWRLARTLDGVSGEAFAAEKGVVRNERRQRGETSAGQRPFELVLQALFPPGHPLARPVSGSEASLRATTAADARAFVERHYRPDNFTLVIAGDVDPDQVGRLLGRWPAELLFGPGGAGGPARAPRPPLRERLASAAAPPHQRTLQRFEGPIAQPELVLAWSLPPGHRGDGALLRLTAARLGQALEEGLDPTRDGDIEQVNTQSVELVHASIISLTASLRPGADPEWARTRLMDILGEAWTGELRDETAASRWSAATVLLATAVEPLTRALAQAEHLAATGRTTYFLDHFRALTAVQPGRVRDLALDFLGRDRAVAIYVEPESSQIPSVSSGTPAPAEERRPDEHQLDGPARAPLAELSSDRIRQTVPSPGLARLPRFRLANGLELFIIPRPSAPVAQLELGLRGGDASARPVGLASLAADLHPARCQRQGSLAAVGGRMLGLQGLTESETFVRVLSGNLANGIAALADSVRCREPDDEALLFLPGRLQDDSQLWRRARRRPELAAGQRLWSTLYPGHPFGEAGYVDPLQLAEVSAGDTRAFVQAHFRPDNAVLVVHGDVVPAAVKALADQHLGPWSGSGQPALPMAPPPVPAGPTRRTTYLVDRPGAAQASLSLGCRLADGVPERRPAYDVLEELAGHLAWGVRERWGASYGVYARVVVMPGNAAHLQLTGTVENAAVARALTRLLAVIRDMAQADLDPALFAAMRWDVGRGFASRFALASVQASAIRSAFHHRWPLEVWDRYPENLAATTPAMVASLMERCQGREVLAIVGDASSLGPQLEAAGFHLEDQPQPANAP
jgi:zinc protease